ncbi:hypothetical protein Nepgr_009675 [Nepenthes gracilis]|uniref:Amine oxidase domain-containing protein n=1 Tax=Nepenthes gracilis TaxID=150966 RepID=A0AAD3SAZ1_NEPGR|nr:hypothetical protein Nepgr_009675 [Nepenthes gracilis]
MDAQLLCLLLAVIKFISSAMHRHHLVQFFLLLKNLHILGFHSSEQRNEAYWNFICLLDYNCVFRCDEIRLVWRGLRLMRLHGVCHENPLAPLIRRLGLTLYRTSGDNSVLYDHDLESCSLFDIDGKRVPQQMVIEVGETFKRILKETEKVRDDHGDDMSVLQAISIVLDRRPELRLGGLAHEVLQWYICRMEAWFAADADMISLKNWDQEHVLSGGHGLMMQGYNPLIEALAEDIDIRLNHRVTKICNGHAKVKVTVDSGAEFIADVAIITVPLGILKANRIEFEPKLPDWKISAISDLGVGNENKIALRFSNVFWPNVELLGMAAPTSFGCGYFLNLHKAIGQPVLVYMTAGRSADALEKLSDESAVNFVMLQLKKMFPTATEPIQFLVSRWGTDPNSLGCYSYDLIGKPEDVYERLRAPVGNLFFGGEAVSTDHQGSVHGAYSAGVMAAESCQLHLLKRLGNLEKLHLVTLRNEFLDTTFPLQISRM